MGAAGMRRTCTKAPAALPAVVRAPTIAPLPWPGPRMRKPLAITAIVAFLGVPGMREAAAAEPQAGEGLALLGKCFVETAGRRNALRTGDAVHVGDRLDVTAGAKLK